MPDNGLDFEKRFGKSASEMDDGEKYMAIISILCDLCKTTKNVPTMELFYKIMMWATPIMISILATFGVVFVNHLSK